MHHDSKVSKRRIACRHIGVGRLQRLRPKASLRWWPGCSWLHRWRGLRIHATSCTWSNRWRSARQPRVLLRRIVPTSWSREILRIGRWLPRRSLATSPKQEALKIVQLRHQTLCRRSSRLIGLRCPKGLLCSKSGTLTSIGRPRWRQRIALVASGTSCLLLEPSAQCIEIPLLIDGILKLSILVS